MQEDVIHKVADEFINIVNEFSDDRATPLLSAANMYAADRYNAFNSQAVDSVESKRDEAIRYYTEQYK